MKFQMVARVVALGLMAGTAAADGRSNLSLSGVGLQRSPITVPLQTLPEPDLAAAFSASAQTEGLTEAWLLAQPAPEGDAEWQCLTEALYFEARGESLDGQVAVAEVILNRVASPLYPRTVCGVVNQRGGGGCQFSYTCDGRTTKMRETGAADLAGRIARAMLDGAPRLLTEGATHFHSHGVRPGWSKRFSHTATIGAHAFYRQPG